MAKKQKLSEWKDCWRKPIKVQYREVQPIELNLLGDWGESVKTREGELWGYVGVDYIIKGVKGEEYPIGKTIFEETYTLTDEVSAFKSKRGALKVKAEKLSERLQDWGETTFGLESRTEYWLAFLSMVEEVKVLEARLCAVKAMVNFHCLTFKDFPDIVHCGSPKTKTCSNYYLCETIKKALEAEG